MLKTLPRRLSLPSFQKTEILQRIKQWKKQLEITTLNVNPSFIYQHLAIVTLDAFMI